MKIAQHLVLAALQTKPHGPTNVRRLARALRVKLRPGMTRAQIAGAVADACEVESSVGKLERMRLSTEVA